MQAFRRSESDIVTSEYALLGLDPAATYELRNLDIPDATRMQGAALMDTGLAVTIPDRRSAVVIRYAEV